jgi:hypothetical protein
MTRAPAAFAIPGDIETVTGGYIYERRLLDGLRAEGREVAHLRLGAGFPDPSPDEMADAVAQMAAVPPEVPLIVDGLVFGAVETAGLATVRAPMVAMIHHPLALEAGLTEDRRRLLQARERDNLARAAHVVVNSPHTAATLAADYAVPEAKISVALPGVDRPAQPQTPQTPPLLLSVGIRHPRKGHDVLLQALARIADLDWQAAIVGSDYHAEHAAELDALRNALGLEARVRFAGLVPEEDLARLYRTASVFVLASRYEGYGMAFAEALVHGLPVVACRTGAVPETVPEAAGLLVPPEDPGAFAEALRAVLEDDARRMALARAAAEAGSALPRWADTVAVMSGVLDTLAAR